MTPTPQDREEAFLAAYDQYADAIFRHCSFRLRDRELGKDIMQETFTRTWEYIAQGHDVENLRAFLYRIANNLIVDEVRRKRPISLEMLQESGFDPGVDETHKLKDSIDFHRILDVLGHVEQPYRDVLVMRYIDDLPPKDIAAILGESPNAISVRLHRGLEKLRSLLRHGRPHP